MKRKFILLCILVILFAQVKFVQKEITGKLLLKQSKNLTFDAKGKEPVLSLGSVRAEIIRKKIADLWQNEPSKDKQTYMFMTTRISKK